MTFKEFKKIGFESLVRLEREAIRKNPDARVMSIEPGWVCCKCGFETHSNKEFYAHLKNGHNQSL